MIDQEEIHNQCLIGNREKRIKMIKQIKDNFLLLPDKQQAWNDLIRLTNDDNYFVRFRSADVLGSVFSDVPDKQQAWKDLIKLTSDEDSDVRSKATSILGSIFPDVPDKQQVGNDLIKLITDKSWNVRYWATSALGSAFSQVPDKQQAWNNLIKLTAHVDSDVRSRAASILGSIFPDVLEKEQAWNDLIKLTTDEDHDVRTSANHSLGKVSIFKASQSEKEEEYKRELEKAIEFFEKASRESSIGFSSNPSQFCLPFYHSFYTIIFQKQEEAKEEVDKYLAEAKYAVGSSKSKELLFEAVENLAAALKETQSMADSGLETKKCELNFYRKYCDRATELMKNAEETAPFATIAMRKGLPILDRNLKELLEDIQNKAKIVCRESRGTDAEGIICEINKEIQNAISDDQRQYIEILEDVVSILKMKIPQIEENRFIFSRIEAIENKKVSPEKYHDLPLIISCMNTMKVVSAQELSNELQTLDCIYNKAVSIEGMLNCTKYDLSKIKLYLANLVIPTLDFTKKELKMNNEICSLNTLALDKLSSQTNEFNSLIKDCLKELDEMKSLIDDLPKNDDIQIFYNKLNELKQSKSDALVQRYSAIILLLDFGKKILQLFVQHYYLN